MKFIYQGTMFRGRTLFTSEVKVFGLTFKKGEPVEVVDSLAIRKLSLSKHFTKATSAPEPTGSMGEPVEAPKKRGRKKKAAE